MTFYGGLNLSIRSINILIRRLLQVSRTLVTALVELVEEFDVKLNP